MVDQKKDDYMVDVIEILTLIHSELFAIRQIIEGQIETPPKDTQKTIDTYRKV